MVKPFAYNLHRGYTFSIKVTAGSTIESFGPFELQVGCYSPVVSIQNPDQTSSTTVTVGNNTALSSVFIFENPTSSVAWCPLSKNEAVDIDGVSPFKSIV